MAGMAALHVTWAWEARGKRSSFCQQKKRALHRLLSERFLGHVELVGGTGVGLGGWVLEPSEIPGEG